MQYRIAVLFAVTAAAVPFGLNDGNAVQPRSDETSNGDVGLGLNLLSNGDSTGVKNAKRDDEDFITDYIDSATNLAKDFAKRDNEDSAGDVGLGLNLLSNGDSTGVKNAKRDNEESAGDVGLGLNLLSNGDSTGVKNARREEDTDASLVGPVDASVPVNVNV
ncbi:hypothetical protein N7493_004368 [Penicillium malachiteum]|uniref:Uncharacterized protein n=1 Tax=Penicillium malachiteum TaxID=1324776 RepID=A0AAD6MWZ3_9EURO|nr:hypothetical protein N7493_004368 [Penicillium malachiteum]